MAISDGTVNGCTCNTSFNTTSTTAGNTAFVYSVPQIVQMTIDQKLELLVTLRYLIGYSNKELEMSTRVAIENRIKELIDELR